MVACTASLLWLFMVALTSKLAATADCNPDAAWCYQTCADYTDDLDYEVGSKLLCA